MPPVTEEGIAALMAPAGREFLQVCIDGGVSAQELILKNAGRVDGALLSAAAEQLACRKRCLRKHPRLGTAGLLAESSLLEQSTAEAVARARTALISGASLFDATGGLGVDSLAFARRFSRVTYAEIDPVRCALFRANCEILGAGAGIDIVCGDSMDHLAQSSRTYDWIFVDPARRSRTGKRRIELTQWEPDIIAHETLLLSRVAAGVAVKIAPAFDVTRLRTLLPRIDSVTAISLGGEVKELLVLLRSAAEHTDCRLGALCLDAAGNEIYRCEHGAEAWASTPAAPQEALPVLCEPDGALIKMGLTGVIAREFGLYSFNLSGVFLQAPRPIAGFPGRQFRVVAAFVWSRKAFKAYLRRKNISRASLIRRDFPLSPQEIRRRFSLGESAKTFFIFTRDNTQRKVVLHGERID
ncbi:MAG: class I SAM-dependent methyltransferase [Fibrobacterota bacterium]